jgi:hypothetical protein
MKGASGSPLTFTSAGNLAVGNAALYSLQGTAAGNTALGYQAGYSGTALTTGTNNVFIGYNAAAKTATDTNEIVIGEGATGNGTNTVVIGNASTPNTQVGMQGVCHALYSFAVDGGAVSTITPATNCTIPAKAILYAATTKTTFSLNALLNGSTTFAAPVKVTASGAITVTVGTAVLTAGVIEIWVQYYQATN